MTHSPPRSMKRSHLTLPRLLVGLALSVILLGPALRAQTATQNVTLSNGWNAVWLEVEPRDGNGDLRPPEDVFTNTDIKIVVTPKPLVGLNEFFAANPDAGGTISTFNQSDWEQWRRIDPPASNSLSLIFGNRPYLVFVENASPSPFALSVAGTARFFRPTWTADRYNLVGFGINGTVSFTDFFAPVAKTHPVARIYGLNTNGNWEVVTAADPVVDGRAYWIFSSGNSDYMGPVSVGFDHAITGELNFGGPGDAVAVGPAPTTLQLDLSELVFTNRGGSEAVPELDLISPDPLSGAADLQLHVVIPTPNTLAYSKGSQIDSTAGVGGSSTLGETVASGTTAVLTLGAKRSWINRPEDRTNLYRLTTGTPGTKVWLPITARSTNVPPSNDTTPLTGLDSAAGLWVGEVSVSAITSIVEDGAPVRTAASAAPIRILLHSDSSNTVTLLNQVTIMQTKTADPEVESIPVLVVRPDRIPFFEGVKERNGKKVGLRIQTVAYDMPRDTRLAAQSEAPLNPNKDDIVDMIVAESSSPSTTWLSGAGLYSARNAVDEAAIQDYLLFRSIRPPALKETYRLKLPMSGAIGPDKVVSTVPGSLTLDPFHRTNPFRHAFHQRHTKGPSITREISIVFDSDQGISGRLRGRYTETVQGLTKSTLELTGRITLQRVSTAALDAAP